MKRSILLIIVLSFTCPWAIAEIVPLTILHTNDLHAHLLSQKNGQGGAARIAGYMKKVREQEQYVLNLNAGDMISGTPVSSMFKGDPIFRVLNHWGLDAAALGNHEFDYGWDRIRRYQDIAAFPLLCANAYTTGTDGMKHLIADEEYKIFTFGNVRIGVISVVAEWTPNMTVKEAVRGITFLPSIETLQRLVPVVSKQADIVIALTHVGYRHDRTIAEEVDGIDLIIGGHSHTVLKEIQKVRNIPILQAGDDGLYVGRIDIRADTETDSIVEMKYTLLEVDESLAAPDSETQKEINRWEKETSEMVDRPLGEAAVDLSKNDMILLANDAFLEATGADYAHQNRGGTRGGIPKGTFSYRTIWNIYPFENTLVTAQVKGNRLPDAFFGHEPIDPEKEYTIVTNSFVRDQWVSLFPAFPRMEWTDTGIPLRDSIIKYIEKREKIGWLRLVR